MRQMPYKNPSRRTILSLLGGAALGKGGRVELGVCGTPDAFDKAKQWGFDYFEPGAATFGGHPKPANEDG